MNKPRKKEILISKMDGYFNVHDPSYQSRFQEFKTLGAAKQFSKVVERVGFMEAYHLLVKLKQEFRFLNHK